MSSNNAAVTFDPFDLHDHPLDPAPEPLLCNGKIISTEDLDALRRANALGGSCLRSMNQAASHCCSILGVDPKSDDITRDLASEIVMCQIDPLHAIRRINQAIDRKEANRLEGGASF